MAPCIPRVHSVTGQVLDFFFKLDFFFILYFFSSSFLLFFFIF